MALDINGATTLSACRGSPSRRVGACPIAASRVARWHPGGAGALLLRVSYETQPPDAAPARPRLLIVEDDERLARAFARMLKTHFHVVCVHSVTAALRALEEGAPFVAVWSDHHLPNEGGGIVVLRAAKQRFPDAVLLMVTGHSDAPALEELPSPVRVFDKSDSAVAIEYLLQQFPDKVR